MLMINNIDQTITKQSNKAKILNLVYENREITKQEIAKALGLSIPTVISNVNLLLEDGILEEYGVAASTGGRKPVIIRFVKDSKYSIGVEISSKVTRIILTNLYLEIKTDRSFSNVGLKGINDIIDKLKQTITEIIEEYKISYEDILGIGFSLPGIVDEENLYLENAPNIGFKNIDFKEFEDKLGMAIYMENDANAAALAESVIGIAKSKSNLVYLEISEGIGAGIVANGFLYKGQNKKAGEIGHMKISMEDLRCNCGRKGCWELYASERALLGSYNNRSDKMIDSLEELFSECSKGDELVKNVIEEYIDYLSMGIQNIILAFSPEYVIIGGKISRYEDILIRPLTKRILQESSLLGSYNTKIIFSKLKEDSSILGATLLPISRLFK
ncbi:ROK family transcriptional regulator [Wukongibacter sp. M2B1]|uniref:ROK family transcriptional regulator n=1 Tax=Wukongibacter sp. M2B1 TaxID=3088895 RepID=UPI003D7AA45C